MEVIRHGKYKSAVEPYLQNKMSSENREQIKELLEHEIVGLPPLQSGPSHFDLMRKDGVPVLSQEEIYAQQPPRGVGGGYKAGL